MSLFLFASSASFLIVLLLTFVDIRKNSEFNNSFELRFGENNIISVKLVPSILRFIQLSALILLIATILFLIFWQIADPSHYLYDTYSLLTSTHASRIILGFIFGALFGIWSIRMYRMKPTEDNKLPVVHKIEGAALLLLLFVGVTSIPIEDYVRGVSVKDGAFNFQLSSASQVGAASNNSKGEGAGHYQSKDDNNGKAFKGGNEPGLVIAVALTSLMTSDSGYMQNRESVLQTKDDAITLKAQELKQAGDKYTKNIQPFALCVRQLTATTKDNQQFREELVELKPFVRELFELQNAMLRRDALSDVEQGKLKQASETVLEDLYYRLASGARRLVASADHLSLVGATPNDQGALSGCSSLQKAIKTAYTPKNATNGENENNLFQKGAELRPYLAILFAGLLQLEGQELAGIQVLQQWLELYEANGQSKSDPAAEWYRIRIVTTQVWLFNTLYERLGQQPNTVQRAFLAALQDAIDVLEELPEIENDYKKIFLLPNKDIRDSNFLKDFGVQSRCSDDIVPSKPSDKIKLKLAGALLSLKSTYARRAINRGEIRDGDIPKVTNFAEEIIDANQNCYSKYLLEVQPRGRKESIARIRGENLLTYALFMQSLANGRKLISNTAKSESLSNLETSMNALRLAASIIEPYGKSEDANISGLKLLDNLDSTPNQRLWDEVQVEMRRLERILNRYR